MALSYKQLWEQATRKPPGDVVHYSGYSIEWNVPHKTPADLIAEQKPAQPAQKVTP